MAFENLLRPGRINTMPMRNRFIAGPLEKAMANLDGTLNERYIAYARARAAGGVALIVPESTYVSAGGRGNPYQVGCHGDHVIPGLRRLAEAVHEHGARLAMELHHGGRQASPTAHHRRPIAPSGVASDIMGPGSIPREMTPADIRRVIDDFAAASERCLEAGVDMIHLHGAHGYLLGQFLSPLSNVRTDGYGGRLENRARFGLEVLAVVRRVVGRDYPIGYRLSASEYLAGGLEVEEAAGFAVMLADAGIDLIDVAGGAYDSMTMIFQGPDAPKGGFVDEAAAIRRSVGDRVPVSVAQRMNDPHFAASVMEREGFEYVTIARGFHADPDYVRKLAAGAPEEILPCIACNTCVNLCVARTPAGCAANPRTTFEEAPVYVGRPPRRILVVGGGVAGLQAARLAAEHGHDVTLREAAGELGGQLRRVARALPDYRMLVDWLSRRLPRLGVVIEMGRPVTVADVEEFDPDVVVVATGATGGYLWAEDEHRTVPLFDLLTALDRPTGEWEGAVAVLGGDYAACVVARYLRRLGVAVHIIESGAAVGADGQFNGVMMEMELDADEGVSLHRETLAEAIIGDRVMIERHGEADAVRVDAVVVGGRVPDSTLADELGRAGLRASVHTIGDAERAGDIHAAGRAAAELADRIGRAAGASALSGGPWRRASSG